MGRLEEALASYDTAIALRSNYAAAHSNRGSALHSLSRFEEALVSYDKAIAIQPDNAQAFNNRGTTLDGLNRVEEALASYDKALALQANYAAAAANQGNVLHSLNRIEEALASYDRAITLRPEASETHVARCMAELPILYRDEREIAARRSAYEASLRTLASSTGRGAPLPDLEKGVGLFQPFYLAYQGSNDRDLQKLYGNFACAVMARRYPAAALPPRPGTAEPVRVGIVSGFFRQHSNWKLPIKGWLSALDHRQFRLFGYHTGVRVDAATKAAAALCERFVQGPKSVDGWRAEILRDAPHVLIYPEVGMDRIATLLAAQRIAAVQCNSWGHPDTSGFPTLDYFLSSDLMEPADGQDHYSERLIRLPNLSVYCEPVEPPAHALRREDFGLRPAATVYWCGQSLYKYLPQFDAVFPRIAHEVGDCQFVFIRYARGATVTDLFRERLGCAFAALGLSADRHCMFLPQLEERDFVAMGGLCDGFLDSIGWSGCNSTLESLAYDLPIVTIPGTLMRGRHSAAILGMMGVTETIAETVDDYVSTAIRLAQDLSWRAAARRQIADNKHKLYRDTACIAALERFLNDAARGGTRA
jgi:protein O-GlcNAc transferase